MLKLKSRKVYSKGVFISLSLVFFIGLSLLCPAGCSRPESSTDTSDDGFKIMEVKNKIAHFSFEYRTYYHEIEDPNIVDDSSFRFTSLTIAASKKTVQMPNPEPGKSGDTVEMSYTPASIYFNIGNALKLPYRFATERIDNSIISWGTWPNFELFERKSIMISGQQAEMASYQVDGILVPKLLFQADVAFDYNGQAWDLQARSDIALAESVKDDLEHIIKTFKILD